MLPQESHIRFFRCYSAALNLLPEKFRATYAQAMLQTARDALSNGEARKGIYSLFLMLDLLSTVAREHISVLPRVAMKRPIALYSSALIVLLCSLSLISTLVNQQLLRRSANQPQLQMAERYAAKLEVGADPKTVLPGGHVDPSRDLDPFLIFYDEAFHPAASTATLAGSVPVPPRGVFEETQRHGRNVLTWKPIEGTRIAMVMLHVSGAHPGYLLVGRSLSLDELYQGFLYHGAVLSMAIILVLVVAAGLLLARAFRHAGHVLPPNPAVP